MILCLPRAFAAILMARLRKLWYNESTDEELWLVKITLRHLANAETQRSLVANQPHLESGYSKIHHSFSCYGLGEKEIQNRCKIRKMILFLPARMVSVEIITPFVVLDVLFEAKVRSLGLHADLKFLVDQFHQSLQVPGDGILPRQIKASKNT